MQRSTQVGVIGWSEHLMIHHLCQGTPWKVRATFDPYIEGLARAQVFRSIGEDLTICDSVEALLAHPGIDLFVIGAPPEERIDYLDLALRQAERPTFCESPLAATLDELSRLEEILISAEQQRILVASCLLLRGHYNSLLPPQWIKANYMLLRRLFGPLQSISVSSVHPLAEQKQGSGELLLHKLPPLIDWLRFLLGNFPMRLESSEKATQAYGITGTIYAGLNKTVTVTCIGQEEASVQADCHNFMLEFKNGQCSVDGRSGKVQFLDSRTQSSRLRFITPLRAETIQEMYAAVTRSLPHILQGGARRHTTQDLLVSTAATVHLAHTGEYRYQIG